MRSALKLQYHSHKERIKKIIKSRRRAKYLWEKNHQHTIKKMLNCGIHFFKSPLYSAKPKVDLKKENVAH